MLFKLVLAVALFSGALLFIAHQGAPASEATRRGRYWPLLAAAGLITLMFWAHLASLMLVIAIGAAMLVYLLRGTRRRVFGNKQVSLWTVAAVVMLAYVGLTLLVKLVIIPRP